MRHFTSVVSLVLIVVCLILAPAGWLRAAPATAPLGETCQAGGVYQPACDLDHDGDMDVMDIELAAGHWGQAGTYVETGWLLTGNGSTTPGVHFLGTMDDQALELKVANGRVLRLEPSPLGPNVLGGHSCNNLTPGVAGATVSGGGGGAPPRADWAQVKAQVTIRQEKM